MNRVTLIGNLGGNPELRSTQNGMEVANFSVATKEVFLKDNQKMENTEWHRIVVWGKLAKSCATYLHKGSSVCVEGRLQTRKYAKNGVDHYATEIVATNVIFLTPKKDDAQGSYQQGYPQQQGPETTNSNQDDFDYSQIPF